ncbi:MAG: hypothetical protein Q7J98_11905 [Kiritimatiellia bacterium]|nr:hypothetical protein [Kiritimatiellia bacterium]
MKTIFASGVIAVLLGSLSAAWVETATRNVRVFASEPVEMGKGKDVKKHCTFG